MSEAQRPKLAAKVILLRTAEGRGFEVFLTRAGESISSFDFPGDTVSKEDCSSRMLRHCRSLSTGAVRDIIGARFTPGEASGPWVTGIRTLFVTLGVLLAVNDAGQDAMLDPVRRVRLLCQRDPLRTRSLTFESFLAKERLWGDASKLVYFSSWQITSAPGIKFDTPYYLTALSPAQKLFPVFPSVGRWLRPDQAVLACDRGGLRVSFSTFASLRKLADFDSMQRVFREYGSVRSG
jgi:hypothetical protein